MPEKMVVEALVPERKDQAGKITQPKVGPYSLTVVTGESAEESIKMFLCVVFPPSCSCWFGEEFFLDIKSNSPINSVDTSTADGVAG